MSTGGGRRDAWARVWWTDTRSTLRELVAQYADVERGEREGAAYYRELVVAGDADGEADEVVAHHRAMAAACDREAARCAVKLDDARRKLAAHMDWR